MPPIEWCDRTINPVSGCRRGCEFCYARKMAFRLAEMEKARPGSTGYPTDGDHFKPTFHPEKLDQIYALKGRGKRIFLGSMGDFFSEGVDPEWFDATVGAVRHKPEHMFIILTKWTERFDLYDLSGLPANLWIGVSVTCQADAHRVEDLKLALPSQPKLVSFEPLLGSVDVDLTEIGWVIIGAETGRRAGKIEPLPKWVDGIRIGFQGPVFLKNNLQPFYAEKCRQFPEAV